VDLVQVNFGADDMAATTSGGAVLLGWRRRHLVGAGAAWDYDRRFSGGYSAPTRSTSLRWELAWPRRIADVYQERIPHAHFSAFRKVSYNYFVSSWVAASIGFGAVSQTKQDQ
jgi:hypothetical protein